MGVENQGKHNKIFLFNENNFDQKTNLNIKL